MKQNAIVLVFFSSDRKTSKMGFGTSVLEQGWSETPRHGESLLCKVELLWLDENHENWIPKTWFLNPPHIHNANCISGPCPVEIIRNALLHGMRQQSWGNPFT